MYRATSMALLTLAAAVSAATLPAGAAADVYTGTSGAPPQQSDIIGGYSSSPSLTGGDVLDLRVSAPAGSRYRIDIVRLGVGGVPGEQVIDCIPGCGRDEPAVAQPAAPPPDAGGEVAAHWQVTDTWQAPDGLATGFAENQALVAILSTQLWYEHFIKAPQMTDRTIAAAPRVPGTLALAFKFEVEVRSYDYEACFAAVAGLSAERSRESGRLAASIDGILGDARNTYRAAMSGTLSAAAQEQMVSNASLLLGIGVPCVIGMWILAPGISATFLGKSFRAAAVGIMPAVAQVSTSRCASLLQCTSPVVRSR